MSGPPGPRRQAPPEGGARAAARIAWGFLDRSSKARLVISAALTSVTGLMDFAALLVLGPWIAGVVSGGAGGGAPRLPFSLPWLSVDPTGPGAIVTVAALYLLRVLAAAVLLWWNISVMSGARVTLADRGFVRFLRATPESALAGDRGRYQSVVADGPGRVADATLLALGIVGDLFTSLAIVAGLTLLDAGTTLAALGFLGTVVWLLTLAARSAAAKAGSGMASSGPLLYRVRLEAYTSFREIALYGVQEAVATRHREVTRVAVQSQVGLSYLSQLQRFVLELAVVVGIAMAAGSFILVGRTPSEFAASLALLAVAGFRLAPTIGRLGSAVTSLRSHYAPLALFAGEMEALRTERPLGSIRVAGDSLVLEAVSYRYPGSERPAIRDVALSIPWGSSLALVGPSGAGKTTLGLLLAGLLEPSSGSIRVSREEGFTSRAREGTGLVPQEVTLLRGSVAYNIAFSWGSGDPNESLLEEVARAAGLDAVLAGLPGGLDAEVGDAGSTLSAGERQRIGFARALYRRPALLVLDEATSALDTETERLVTDVVAALHGEATIIVIAHRLHTVRNCDRIAFLEDGELVAVGPFSELERSNPAFRRMVELSRIPDSG